MSTVDDDSLPALDVDRELRKKILSRRKQQRYRQRINAGNEQLKEHAKELEMQLERLKKGNKQESDDIRMLSWQEVALALQQDNEIAFQVKEALQKHRDRYLDLIPKLQEWAKKLFTVPDAPRTDIHTWRNVTLYADQFMRREGIDWVTKHLFHNTDLMLDRYRFPEKSFFNEVAVEVDEINGYQCVHRFQVEVDFKMDDIAAALRDNIWKFLMVGALNSMDPETSSINADMNIFRHTAASNDEAFNLLSREFLGKDRCVFVGEQIEDDEAIPVANKRQRRRLLWIILDKLDFQRTKLRIIFMNSHSFTKEGYLSLDDEALLWGCRLNPHDDDVTKARMFRNHVLNLTKGFNKKGQMRFNEAILRTTNSPPSSPPPIV